MYQIYACLKASYIYLINVCLKTHPRTLAENSVELRLAVQAKEMGRIQAAINAQVDHDDYDLWTKDNSHSHSTVV